jgi:hypothetical protein
MIRRSLSVLVFLVFIASWLFSHDELAEQVKLVTSKIKKDRRNAELYFQHAELLPRRFALETR